MLLHFIVLILSVILSSLYDYFDKKNKKVKNIFLIILILGLSCFIGYRSLDMGIDTKNYYSAFKRNDFSFDLTEIGFPILIRIANMLKFNYSQFFTLISVITLCGTLAFVHKKFKGKHGIYTFLYITSFSFLYSCSASRFFCALSFIIISNYYMCKNCKIKSIVYILIAMLFHFSAIIFLPINFIAKKKKNNKFWLIYFSLLGIGVIFNIIGLEMLSSIIPSKYLYILKNNSNSLGMSTIKSVVEFIYLYSYRKVMGEEKNEYDYFLSILLFSILIDFIPGTYRTIWFFKFPVWFLWSMLIKKLETMPKENFRYNNFFAKMILYTSYIVWYVVLLNTMGENQNLIPYKFSI